MVLVPSSERSVFSIRLGLPLAFASWRSRPRPHAQERQHVAAAAASPPIGVVLSPDSIGISARTSSFFASRMASPSRGDGGLGAVIATLVLPGSVYVTHARLDLLEQLGFPGATGRWPSSSGSPSSLQSALTP